MEEFRSNKKYSNKHIFLFLKNGLIILSFIFLITSWIPAFADSIFLDIIAPHTVSSPIEFLFDDIQDLKLRLQVKAFIRFIFSDFNGGPVSVAPWADGNTIGPNQTVSNDGAVTLDYSSLNSNAQLIGILLSPQLASTATFNLLPTQNEENTSSSGGTNDQVEDSTEWIIIDGPSKGIIINSEPGFPEIIDAENNPILNAGGSIRDPDSGCLGPNPYFAGSLKDETLLDMCGWGHVVELKKSSIYLQGISIALTDETKALLTIDKLKSSNTIDRDTVADLGTTLEVSTSVLKLQFEILKLLRSKLKPKNDLLSIAQNTRAAIKFDKHVNSLLDKFLKQLNDEKNTNSKNTNMIKIIKGFTEFAISSKEAAFVKIVENEEKLKIIEEEISEQIDEVFEKAIEEEACDLIERCKQLKERKENVYDYMQRKNYH